MNLDMVEPKNETENFLFSVSKNCETLIKKTHRKAEGTLEFKVTKPRETFSFNQPFSNEGSWMVGLPCLEVHNFVFNITEEENKFERHTATFDEFSFAELKGELQDIINIAIFSHKHLQDKILGPRIIKTYQNNQQRRHRLMVIICF